MILGLGSSLGSGGEGNEGGKGVDESTDSEVLSSDLKEEEEYEEEEYMADQNLEWMT